MMEVVSRRINLILFFTIAISVYYTATAQNIAPGKYQRTVGVHGSTETLIFKNDSVIYSKLVKTRPRSEVCFGKYYVKDDSLIISYEKDSIPFQPYFKVSKKLNSKERNNNVIVHLNVLIKRIPQKNEIYPKLLAVYGSTVSSSRINIIVLDSVGNKIANFTTFTHKAILELSKKHTLMISGDGSFFGKLDMDQFKNNEIFIDYIVYEKYDLPCSKNKQLFHILKNSDERLLIQENTSNMTFTFEKLE